MRHDHRFHGSFRTGFGLTMGYFAARALVSFLCLLFFCGLPLTLIFGIGSVSGSRQPLPIPKPTDVAAPNVQPIIPVESKPPTNSLLQPTVDSRPKPADRQDEMDPEPVKRLSPGTPDRPFSADRTLPPKPATLPVKSTRTLHPLAGKLVLAKSEFALTQYEGVAYDPKQVAAMVADKRVLILTDPIEADVLKQWEADSILRVIPADGVRKGDLLYCRRAHLTPPKK